MPVLLNRLNATFPGSQGYSVLRTSYVYTDTVSRRILLCAFDSQKQPEAKEHGHGQLTKMMNEAILMMVVMVALSPAAHAASCISSSLIITELGDPSSVPDGIDAARARFVQLYVFLSFFSPPNTIAMHCR